MIVNLRGTNSSGKTTAVRTLLAGFTPAPIYGVLGPRLPEAYRLVRPRKPPLFVVGPYTGVPTSGADVITAHSGLALLISLLEKYRSQGHVVYEGILVSVNFGSVGEYLLTVKDEVLLAFLDTSLEDCLEGLKKRQAVAVRQGKSDLHLRESYKRIFRVRERMSGMGFRCETVSRENAVEKILGWLV